MGKKFAVSITIMAEGESPQEVAQRLLEAVAPHAVHPVILMQCSPLDEPEGPQQAEPEGQADAAAQVFGRIMDAPTM